MTRKSWPLRTASWAIGPPIAAGALGDKDRIRDIARAFAKHDVMLAEVGRWCNLIDADPAKRAANLRTVTEGLALAEAIGARCASTSPARSTPRSGSVRTAEPLAAVL